MNLKRVFDLTLILVALPFCAVVLLVIATLSILFQGRSVLFYQVRLGRHERPFSIVKFRTMSKPESDHLCSSKKRITPFGRMLRRSSLDELPALWNVLKGEMSLVGPRPLPVEYRGHLSAGQRKRHEVLPGITGLAQVNGRNRLNWSDKFRSDLEYIEKQSMFLDILILLRTVVVVAEGGGLYANDGELPRRLDGYHKDID